MASLSAQPPRPGPALRVATPQLTPAVRRFIADEAGSAAVLLVATIAALVWANSPWSDSYVRFWTTDVSFRVGSHGIDMDLQRFVNEALMAIFFCVLGLEISRERTTGQLQSRRTITIPALGAVGGMLLPIGIFLLINGGHAGGHGWGIVMSSDTAFVLGILALFGPRCPDQLRLFLLALAVVDDIGAIVVLAGFYSPSLHTVPVEASLGFVVGILVLRWLGVWQLTPYIFLGLGLWYAVYRSGLHPTLAGVVLGLLLPARPTGEEQLKKVRIAGRALIEERTADRARMATQAAAAAVPATERLQQRLHPWSAYLVVPVFGLANAGVHLSGGALSAAYQSRVTLGILVALVVGNAVGISGATYLGLRTGLGELPGRVRYSHLIGGAVLAGMGFTISLFITDLAFSDPVLRTQAKVGILTGSLIAAALGAWVLRVMGERSPLCSPASDRMPQELPPLPWAAYTGSTAA
jgi:NhaA family Na+:H+ antiporter